MEDFDLFWLIIYHTKSTKLCEEILSLLIVYFDMCDPSAFFLPLNIRLLLILLLCRGITMSESKNLGDSSYLRNVRPFENIPEKLFVNLESVGAGSRVSIDLFLARNRTATRIDFIDSETDVLYRSNGSMLNINFNGSSHGTSSKPRHICIKRKLLTDTYPNEQSWQVSSCVRRSNVYGIRVYGDRVTNTDEGSIEVPTASEVKVLLFGTGFKQYDEIAFTTIGKPKGSRCDDFPLIKMVKVLPQNVLSEQTLKFDISFTPLQTGEKYYLCLKDSRDPSSNWFHQGDEPWMTLKPVGRILPIELQAVIIAFLLILSGLFSGLNLGLMALECTELRVLEKCGSEAEKKYARKIYPVRKQSNYLLCSLLLGNVLVNNTLTILLDDLTSGVIAIVVSTFGIVIFGEIIPQAICSRHGLYIGARTLWITKVFMFLTFPLSFPISKLLDVILGEEIRTVYNRKRLMEFIRVTKDYNDLQNEEVDIISGALELTKKTVADVMTKINDVFMVPITSVLDFETVSEIIKQGYSRIPVYEGERNNVIALLNIKDLAFVDPDTETHLKTLCEFYNHPVNFVFEDTTLDVMLNEFKKGRSHLAFVRRVNTEEDGDPFYELIGIVTLEDVIEEIIQSEIIDETDTLTDNRFKRVRKESQIKQDFSDFARLAGGDKKTTSISPQLALATYQYLSTSVDPFKIDCLSETVLKKLMSQDVFFKSKLGKESFVPSSNILFQMGKPIDYFILILEGRCLVTVSKENLVFESGPFSSFGLPAVTIDASEQDCAISIENVDSPSFKLFVPDYTVVAMGETVYMKVHYAVYLSAIRATRLERQQKQDSDSKQEPEHISQCSSKESVEFLG